MAVYQSKSLYFINAIQWTGNNVEEVKKFLEDNCIVIRTIAKECALYPSAETSKRLCFITDRDVTYFIPFREYLVIDPWTEKLEHYSRFWFECRFEPCTYT